MSWRTPHLIFPGEHGGLYHGVDGIPGPGISGKIVMVKSIPWYLLGVREVQDVFDPAEYPADDPREIGISKD